MKVGSKVPRVPGMGHRDAERIAAKVVRDFRPHLLTEPQEFPVAEFFEYHLVERYGLNTGVADLPMGIEGVTKPDGTIRIAAHVYDQLLDGIPGRPRFTPLHESVHGLVHLPTLRQLEVELIESTMDEPRLYRRSELRPFEDPEWQANRVAEAILMPSQSVQAVLARYGPNPHALMGVFKVSFTAADTRIGHLRSGGRL